MLICCLFTRSKSGEYPNAEQLFIGLTKQYRSNDFVNRFRPQFEEIFFVVSNRGTDPSMRVNSELCDYTNVMCVEYEELIYSNSEELRAMVHRLTDKFRKTFLYFFSDSPEWLDESKEMNAVKRLEAMDKAASALVDQPFDVTDHKFGVHGGHRNHESSETEGSKGGAVAVQQNAEYEPSSFESAGKALEPSPRLTVEGKSFHIFQASPPHTASTVVNNWLMGLFEPDANYSFMINNREQTIRHVDRSVPIDTTIVTKTHVLDLMGLYKKFRPQFDEIFFVVSNRGTSPETRIDDSLCQYNNVLCIEFEDLLFSNEQEMRQMVHRLTLMFQNRFEYFFGPNSNLLGERSQANAVRRLEEMAQATVALADKPFSVSDKKFGVHGGHRNRDGSEMKGGFQFPSPAAVSTGLVRRRLFYCGGAKGLQRKNFKYSTFGLFLATSLFPEVEGKVYLQSGKQVVNTAIPLTPQTLNDANENDLLIMHSHQYCEVSVADFPGIQLHFNVRSPSFCFCANVSLFKSVYANVFCFLAG